MRHCLQHVLRAPFRLEAIATANPPTMTLTVLHATPKVVFSTMLRRVGHLLLGRFRTESPSEAHGYHGRHHTRTTEHQTSPSRTTRRCHHRPKSCNHLMPRMSSGQVANPVPKSCNRLHTAPCRSTYLVDRGRESALLRALTRHQITTCLKLMIAFTNNVRWTFL